MDLTETLGGPSKHEAAISAYKAAAVETELLVSASGLIFFKQFSFNHRHLEPYIDALEAAHRQESAYPNDWFETTCLTFLLSLVIGHQGGVHHVMFSPSGTLISSAGNDSAAKIWDRNGKFLASCRGHIGPVYPLAWVPDFRMHVTASQDSTIKLWIPKAMIFS